MPTNNYFKNFNSMPQQDLLNSLTTEVIQMNGIDVYYLIRTAVNEDTILNEDSSSKFKSVKQVEMYVNGTDGFTGAGDTVSKFGLDIQDELILTVNKHRFLEAVVMKTPREGDLIYFPLNKGLFEIKFVEHEKPFYSLGKNTVFEITCELFQYSDEIFDIPAIEQGAIFEKIERENAITTALTVGGVDQYTKNEIIYQGASLATATVTAKIASQNNNILHVYRVSGAFIVGNPIIGDTSTHSLNIISIDDQDIKTSKYSDNKEFETDGDAILDFTEIDPWSEGDI